jgi:hypothetical protein
MAERHRPLLAPDPGAPRPWWRRWLTRIDRRWQVWLGGRFRDRTARCKVCGKVFEWTAPIRPIKCPECTRKHLGGRLENSRQSERGKR